MTIQVWALRNSTQVFLGTATTLTPLSSSALGSDVTQILLYNDAGGSRGPLLATVTASSPSTGGGGSSSTSELSADPAPVFQQFGKPAVGSCEAAAPESLNWSGVASGGWGESWAQWMNGGNGGAVCTRTLVYSDNLGIWTVV